MLHCCLFAFMHNVYCLPFDFWNLHIKRLRGAIKSFKVRGPISSTFIWLFQREAKYTGFIKASYSAVGCSFCTETSVF